MPDLEQVRSRDNSVAQDGYTSDSSRYSRARQPINEAVNSAFTNSSATTSAFSPEILEQLIPQITANVIQQLKSANIPASVPSPFIPAEKSPSAGSPPSPFRSAHEYQHPTPPSVQQQPQHTPPSPPEKRAMSPLSQSSRPDDGDDKSTRPKGPQRISTSGDMTVVEKIWGTLFNEHAEPTPRLGQFLRGIAMHLIKDYQPKNSLVVTPTKMQRYYQETKLEHEAYPWKDIFDDRTSSISRMLRELEVQHHLVQEKVNERPDIPGLTPQGFETWYTLLIKAHPDQEYERLAKTALDLPISNPDDKRERFPKELSRRLFPKRGDDEVIAKLCKSIEVHCNVSVKNRQDSTTQPAPKTDEPPRASNAGLQPPTNGTGAPRDSPSSNEKPASNRPHSFSSASTSGVAVVSDSEDTPTPHPIERERKPYVAQPGLGKNYDSVNAPMSATEVKPAVSDTNNLKRSTSHRESRPSWTDDYSKPRPAPISIHQHTSSSSATNSAPIEIPESTRRHRNSAYYKDPGPTTALPRRTRSPSASKDAKASARYSEPQDIFNHYGSAPADIERERERERDKRYRDYEAQRERLANDRYDAARMAAYDPRDRDRERGVGGGDTRPRGQSVASYGHVEDEYYRNAAGYPPPVDRVRDGGPVGGGGVAFGGVNHGISVGAGYGGPNGPHYPPTSYRETR